MDMKGWPCFTSRPGHLSIDDFASQVLPEVGHPLGNNVALHPSPIVFFVVIEIVRELVLVNLHGFVSPYL